MLFPYADDNSAVKIRPYVSYALIILNVIVFVLFQKLGNNPFFDYAYCVVPAEILTGKDIVSASQSIMHQSVNTSFKIPALYETPLPVYLTLITSMFMHGGLGHIFGNMFFLYLYGDNIENELGHGRFLLFYLVTGILAGLAHVFATYFQGANPYIPCLGASGAISGVMGAYMFLFPQNKIRALFLYFPITIPAVLSLGIWILFQIINGLGLLGGGGEGGVAYAAHIGGFIAGILLITFFRKNK
jgi:membrane associated rhomboid family serine protease